jgi:steroid delta-isomerase-like uncharacterized protein
MRHAVWIAAALGAPFAACSSNVGAPPQAPIDWAAFDAGRTTLAQSNAPTAKERAVAEAYAAALEAPGFAKLGPLLDEDVHLAFPGIDDAHGRDAVVHAHEVLFGAFDQRRVATSRVWRTASEQTVEWTLSGQHAKDWMGVPASRKTATIQGLTLLWTKDDGSITDVHVYFDAAVVKAQLGVGPKDLLALPPPPMLKGPPQVYDQAGSPDEKNNVDIAHASLDALEKNQEAVFVDLRTDDVEVHTLERAQAGHGKEDSRAYFKAMHKAVGQLDTTVDNAWGVGQFAIVEYFLAGEQVGPFYWVAPQRDKVIRLQVVQVEEIHGGKIARVWRYENPAQIASQP